VGSSEEGQQFGVTNVIGAGHPFALRAGVVLSNDHSVPGRPVFHGGYGAEDAEFGLGSWSSDPP
jgi:hypothetical protein